MNDELVGSGAPATAVAKYNFCVVPMVWTACWRLTPGNWTRIWSLPCACTDASETPSEFTRRSRMGIVACWAACRADGLLPFGGPLRQSLPTGLLNPWQISIVSSVPPWRSRPLWMKRSRPRNDGVEVSVWPSG